MHLPRHEIERSIFLWVLVTRGSIPGFTCLDIKLVNLEVAVTPAPHVGDLNIKVKNGYLFCKSGGGVGGSWLFGEIGGCTWVCW